MAQLWFPAVIALAVRPAPRSTGGLDPGVSLSPIPRSRVPLPTRPPGFCRPQQRTFPSSSTAQVWKSPALIAVAVRPEPRSTGGAASIVVGVGAPGAAGLNVTCCPARPTAVHWLAEKHA